MHVAVSTCWAHDLINMLFCSLLLLPACINLGNIFNFLLFYTNTYTWTLKFSVYFVITFKQNVTFYKLLYMMYVYFLYNKVEKFFRDDLHHIYMLKLRKR